MTPTLPMILAAYSAELAVQAAFDLPERLAVYVIDKVSDRLETLIERREAKAVAAAARLARERDAAIGLAIGPDPELVRRTAETAIIMRPGAIQTKPRRQIPFKPVKVRDIQAEQHAAQINALADAILDEERARFEAIARADPYMKRL